MNMNVNIYCILILYANNNNKYIIISNAIIYDLFYTKLYLFKWNYNLKIKTFTC